MIVKPPRPPKPKPEGYSTKDMQEIYEEIENRINGLGNNIEAVIAKVYMAFRVDRDFVRVRKQRKRILVYLPHMKLQDLHIPKQFKRNVDRKEHHLGGDLQISVSKKSEIPYLMKLVEQSYKKNLDVVPGLARSIQPDEQVHLEKFNNNMKELYYDIRERILKLGDVDVKGRKHDIMFSADRVFIEFRTSKKNMRVLFNMDREETDELRDGNLDIKLPRRVPGYVRINISKKSEIPYLMKLVEQFYRKNLGVASNLAGSIQPDEWAHLGKCDNSIRELYRDIRGRILKLGEVDVEGQKHRIVFRTGRIFVEFRTSKKNMGILFKMNRREIDELRDSNPDIELLQYARGYTRINISKKSGIPYLMKLVERLYKKTRQKK